MMEKKEIGIKVGDIMTRNFIYAKPDTFILDCAKKMIKYRVGSIILMEKDVLKGLLTRRDILWAVTKKEKPELSEIRAEDVVSKKTATIKPSADLGDALFKMRKTKQKRLPVVIKNKIIGLLTLKDILRIEPNLFLTVTEDISIREEAEKIKRAESPETFEVGICEECGNTDLLYTIDGNMICESCKDAM